MSLTPAAIDILIAVAGATILAGLLLEYGGDLLRVIDTRRIVPPRIGPALIVGGLVAAAALHIAAERTASRTLSELRIRETSQARAITALTGQVRELEQGTSTAGRRLVAAEAEIARLRATRSLTPEQQSAIAEKLKPFAGTPYDFTVHPEAEPEALMEDIASALGKAGWVRRPRDGSVPLRTLSGRPAVGTITTFSGVQVEIAETRTGDFGNAALTLRDMLGVAGLPTTALRFPDGNDTADAVHIFIGKKP